MRRILALLTLLFASAFTLAQSAPLLTASSTPGGDLWWKHAVVYEIYPRSFQDSNNDGLGDLHGIEQRLPYLHTLGVDALWITPIYPSPQIDFGYDIADYTAIDPQYGTMADFDALLRTAKAQHLRVLMDLVMNHTSDQHPWFKASASSRTNPKRDWYIWRDGKVGPDGKMGPPNNWQSWFGGSAWKFDPTTGQYYYHYFYTQQPDLNWRNPEVRKAMYGVMRFWLDKGVSGFRIDAISRLFEDPNLHDDPYLPGINAYGDRNIQHKYTDDLPEVHDVLREMRALTDSYPGHPVLITEADEPNIADLTRMYGPHNDEVQLPMDFQIADANQLSAPLFRRLIGEVESNSAHGWPEYFFSNHDQPRMWDRYGDGVHNLAIAKLMAALELTPRATPQMYYGEEIGMKTTDPTRIEDVRDPVGRTGWPKDKGRDGERTPMQWTSAAPNAGFTAPTVTPWLPIPPTARTVNVETESSDPNSLLNFYKSLLALRHTQPALLNGGYQNLSPIPYPRNTRPDEYDRPDRIDPNVFAFLRQLPGQSGHNAIVVALNMSAEPLTVTLDLPDGISATQARVLLSSTTPANTPVNLQKLELAPFAATLLILP